MSAFITDGNDWFNTPGSDKMPPAENVLVQRIPGDNYHLLMMAVYSYENFSQPSFTLDNEQGLINFRDDGKEYDKVAGDGVYTAKIYSDVSEFRKLALKMMQDVKNNKPEPQFVNREEVFNNNCITEPFDIQKFDKNEAVPITNIIGSSNNLIDSIRNNCIFITDLSAKIDGPGFYTVFSELQGIERYFDLSKPSFAIAHRFRIPNSIPINVVVLPTDLQIGSRTIWVNNKKIPIPAVIKR